MFQSYLRYAIIGALLTGSALAPPAGAQTGPNPPPEQDSFSPTGVSWHSGAFRHGASDLAIGPGSFPQALTLERTYLSRLDDAISQRSGTPTQGWSNNLNGLVGNTIVQSGFPAPEGQETYLYSVTIGSGSSGFTGGSSNPTGGFVGGYVPTSLSGEILEFFGDHSTGHFTFTQEDGTSIVFNPMSAGGRAALAVSQLTAPDGTTLSFAYDDDGLRSVLSNRGYALLFEYGNVSGGRARVKACAVNMAETYVTATSACPAGVQTVSYQYVAGTTNGTTVPYLSGVVDANGQTTTYTYSSASHLACVKAPGQSSCRISNTYGVCEPVTNPDEPYQVPYGYKWEEPVLSQMTATGEQYTYNFPATQFCPQPKSGRDITGRINGVAPTRVVTSNSGVPERVTDPNGNLTQLTYTPSMNELFGDAPTKLGSLTRPEGNKVEYTRDGRGNITQTKWVAKANSGLSDIITSATYPTSCSNRKTCNKPTSTTDARGKTTDLAYDSAHGGLVSEMKPAPSTGTARPLKLITWAQKYAYVKNSVGSLVQAATPVWVIASETQCQTVAGSSSPVCDTAAPKRVTTFEYGANGSANNLLARGIVVTADGVSRRSCFSYDSVGNRISQTKPRAGLSTCP